MSRKCTKCDKEYDNVEQHFHKRKSSPSGIDTICKYCKLQNRHRVSHISADGKILCTKCSVYKNKEEFDIAKSQWFREGLDRRCKKCKKKQYEKRRISNRGDLGIERLITERYAGLKDRAKRNGLVVNFERTYLKELWEKQNHICAISGIEMTTIFFNGRVATNMSVDRIDSTKGYIKGNVQLVCMAVNQMKNDLSQEELIFFCNKIVQYEKENNNR